MATGIVDFPSYKIVIFHSMLVYQRVHDLELWINMYIFTYKYIYNLQDLHVWWMCGLSNISKIYKELWIELDIDCLEFLKAYDEIYGSSVPSLLIIVSTNLCKMCGRIRLRSSLSLQG